MTQQEYKATHSYILLNCEEVEPYVKLIFYEYNISNILYCLQLDYILTNISKILSINRIYIDMLQHLNLNILNTEIDAKLEMDFAI